MVKAVPKKVLLVPRPSICHMVMFVVVLQLYKHFRTVDVVIKLARKITAFTLKTRTRCYLLQNIHSPSRNIHGISRLVGHFGMIFK